MGYSCSVRANFTYDAIQMLEEFDTDSDHYKYFCEIGRETKDGSMVGIVFEMLGEYNVNEHGQRTRPCREKGRFKIAKDGSVIRFPGLSKRLWSVVEIASIEAYDKEFSYRRQA